MKRVGAVLMLSPYFSTHGGGVELVAKATAIGLQRRGFVVRWIASDCDSRPNIEGICTIAARSFNFVEKKTGIPVPLWGIRAILQMRNEVRRADVVIVHESLYFPCLAAAVICAIYRKKFILVQHIGMLRFRSRLLSAIVMWGNLTLVAWTHKRAERVVFISESVKQFFVLINAGIQAKARLIENGVDLQTFKLLEESERLVLRSTMSFHGCPVVLFVGRFVEKKGLDIIRRLAERRPNWSWLLVGAGPINPVDWKLPQVNVLGRKSHEELAALYQASDLLISPSTGEGFPLVVQEAMACGLSVVVSNEVANALAGLKGYLSHANFGIDSPKEEDFDSWTSVLDIVIGKSSAESRRQVAEFARERWSWLRSCNAFNDLIVELT